VRLAKHKLTILYSFQHLTKLCSATTECLAALAIDSILQMRMLQAGALWHLLLFMLDYDYTLEEGGVERSADANQQVLFCFVLLYILSV